MIQSKPIRICSSLGRALFKTASFLAPTLAVAQVGFLTSVAPYTVPGGPNYSIVPLLSVGDRVPRTTTNPLQQYQIVGIPDGLGAYRNPDGTVTLLMNHELRNTVQSEPIVGGPINRGAFVSKVILAAMAS